MLGKKYTNKQASREYYSLRDLLCFSPEAESKAVDVSEIIRDCKVNLSRHISKHGDLRFLHSLGVPSNHREAIESLVIRGYDVTRAMMIADRESRGVGELT